MKIPKTLYFCLEGNPISMKTHHDENYSFWNSTKQERFNCKMSILQQYEKQLKLKKNQEPPPIDLPVQLIVHFFLAPKPLKKLTTVNHLPHDCAPRLLDLERFVENILSTTIFTGTCKIAKICADKTYDAHPRTLIEIKVLKGSK